MDYTSLWQINSIISYVSSNSWMPCLHSAVLTWSLIKCTPAHTAVITATLRGSLRDINAGAWRIFLSLDATLWSDNSAHLVSDLIKELLMVTVFYRDSVYVDISMLNGCDIYHLAVPSRLWKRPYSSEWGPNKAFSGLEEKYLQLPLSHLFDSTVNDSKIKDQGIKYLPHRIYLTFD